MATSHSLHFADRYADSLDHVLAFHGFVRKVYHVNRIEMRHAIDLGKCGAKLPSIRRRFDSILISRARRLLMRRFLVFAALGPAIGALTGFWVLAPAISLLAGDPGGLDVPQLLEAAPFLLPVGYMVGLLPALLVCVADEILARLGIRRRPLWCALFGFAAAFTPLATSFAMGFLHRPFVLTFGLIGAAPGAACSWIAGKWTGTPRQSG